MRGFEPLTSSLPRKRSTPELHRRKVLNQLPLKFPYLKEEIPAFAGMAIIALERETGFEPATFSLEGWRSTNWATPAFFIGHLPKKLSTFQKNLFSRCSSNNFCGESRIRTCEGENQQIYSLSSLAAWVSPRLIFSNLRADGGTRTHDLLITNQLL